MNLFQQSAVFMVLAMAEIFALLLGEIDLSIGYVGPVGGVIAVQLVQPTTTNWPWWAAIAVALLALCPHRSGAGHADHPAPAPLVHRDAGRAAHLQRSPAHRAWVSGPFSGYPTLTGPSSNLHALYDLMWGHISPLQAGSSWPSSWPGWA